MSSTRKIAAALAAVLVGSMSACAPQAAERSAAKSTGGDLDPLSIRLNWTYEAADHPWFFAGLSEGIYAKHGIDLKPLEGTGSASTLKLVASGSDPVGFVDSGTMMSGVSKGLPVKSTCVLTQQNPMAAIFRADSGIESLKDLRGATIAVTPGDSLSQIFPAVLAANNMAEKDVTMVGLADPAAKASSILTGASKSFLGYYTIQLLAMEESSGVKMDYLSFADLGVNTLSMAIVVNNDWAAKNGDLLQRFITATQESVQFVVDNPQKAADDFVKGVPSFSRGLALKQINATTKLLHTKASEGRPICWTAESDWQNTEDLLAKYAGLRKANSLDVYYTNDLSK